MTRIINPSNWQNLTTYVSGMLLAAIGIYGLVLTVINLA